jgi:hypothetical protein
LPYSTQGSVAVGGARVSDRSRAGHPR